jgi:hypothetical protein
MAKANIIQKPFRTQLNKMQLISAATVVLNPNQYVELGRFTVQAGTALALGYGAMEGQDSAAGRLYMDFRDNAANPGAVVNGTIRIDTHNAQDRPTGTIFEARTEALRTSATDRTQQLPFPWINAVGTEDVAFVLKFKGDAAVTLGQANTVILCDATNYEAK